MHDENISAKSDIDRDMGNRKIYNIKRRVLNNRLKHFQVSQRKVFEIGEHE